MPYVEVWVDETTLNDEQESAIRELVSLSREIANRQWPNSDAVLLERAASHVARVIGIHGKATGDLPLSDKQYREWQSKQLETANA